MRDPAPDSPTTPAMPGLRRAAGWLLAAAGWTLGWMALEAWFLRRGVSPSLQALAPPAACLALAAAAAGLRRFRPAPSPSAPAWALAGLLALALAAGGVVVKARGGEVLPGGPLDLPLSLLAAARTSDLLRSLWLEGLLVPLAVLAGFQTSGDPSRRPHRLLAAAGLAVLAAASAWNLAGGERLVQTLAPGDVAGVMAGRSGAPVTLPGFRLRLDGLEATPRPPAFRLVRLPEPAGKGPAPAWAARVEAGQAGDLPGGLRYQVEKLIPDARPSGQVTEDPAAPENPAVQVMLGLGNAEPLVGVLFAREADGWRRDEPQGRFAVVYRERFEPSLLQALRPHPPTDPRLVLTFMGKTLEHAARPGDRWDLPGFSLTVASVFPEFGGLQPGPDGRPAFFSRSPVYRDPWIQLRLRQAGGAEADLLLSARPVPDPDYQAYLARTLPPGLTLAYEPRGAEVQSRFVLLTRDDGKARLVQDGRVVRTEPVATGRPFLVEKGLSVTVLARYDHARFEPDFVPDPEVDVTARTERPVLRLRVWDPATGEAEARWLQARGDDGRPVGASFLGGRVRLAYQAKDPDPRDLRATLSILDAAGTRLAGGAAEVGTPFRFGGYRVYLDGGSADAVRLLAVRDPATGLAWAGLVILVAAAVWLGLRGRRQA